MLIYIFSVTLGAKTYDSNFTTRAVTIVRILIKTLLIKLDLITLQRAQKKLMGTI